MLPELSFRLLEHGDCKAVWPDCVDDRGAGMSGGVRGRLAHR